MSYPSQKARLTKALKVHELEREEAVTKACLSAMDEWRVSGWPDDWARWQRALTDTFGLFNAPSLDELDRSRTWS